MSKARNRFTVAEKRDIVSQLRRLGAEGRPPPEHIRAVAAQYGVTTRAVNLWLRDETLTGETSTSGETPPKGFRVDVDMLTVVGNEQNRRTAYEKLRAAGIVNVAYSTFCRAVNDVDPSLVGAALKGQKALVGNRMYLKTVAPHRGWVYHLDHTQLDLFIAPSHRHTKRVVRPWVTVIVDGATGLLWAFPWYRPVNGSMVAAALASVCTRQEYRGTVVGGVPEQVVLDNAGEHFTEQMAAAVTRIGTIMTPTHARSSWQNGKAERAIGLLMRRFADRAPGAINAGEARDGGSRYLENTRGNTDPATLWTARTFERTLQNTVDEINSEIPMKRHGGLTRIEAWRRDQTELRFITDLAARLVALPTAKDTYKATKGGISFNGHDYVHEDLHVGRRYKVRFLPTQTDFIEVFSEDDKHIARAWRSDAIPAEERKKFLAARARIERDAKAIESGLQAARAHQAALDNADPRDDSGTGDVDLLGALDGTNDERAHVKALPKKKRVRAARETRMAPDLAFLQEHLGYLNEKKEDEA
ncbi:transposase [Nocardioides sp. Y6]|uniref:Transposase n=1 Tax=Nocardioides malaquae TaxID=2773426 RepID=A0ABR9RUP5_9ACTN|nr:Mu transposase C-terminal domain-containing protein [Nocardioides malaquae]MBE7325288.1 transposase [Nocardioides malaquae]